MSIQGSVKLVNNNNNNNLKADWVQYEDGLVLFYMTVNHAMIEDE